VRLPRFGAIASFVLVAILTAPAWGRQASTKSVVNVVGSRTCKPNSPDCIANRQLI